ncbi:hypothetical protein QE152_g35902 [Popillia japonica]|uniref:Uncharacterized protein n=1 Tax=Popillia japonica TaxID=7064 RepID=A0AAW1IEU6_POPJA
MNNAGDDTEDLLQDIQDILDTENFFEVPQQLIDEVIVPNEDTDTASEAENEEVIETAHSNQTEEPAQSIPSMDEAIDNKNPQYHFKNTYLNKINVSFNQNQGKKIYEVEVPKENNAEQIFQFIRVYMDQDKHYLYFGNEKIYKDFCNVYITDFNNNGPKLLIGISENVKCTFFTGIAGSTGDVELTRIRQTTGLLPLKLGTSWNTDRNKRERKVHVRNLKYGVVTDSSPGSQDQPETSN